MSDLGSLQSCGPNQGLGKDLDDRRLRSSANLSGPFSPSLWNSGACLRSSLSSAVGGGSIFRRRMVGRGHWVFQLSQIAFAQEVAVGCLEPILTGCSHADSLRLQGPADRRSMPCAKPSPSPAGASTGCSISIVRGRRLLSTYRLGSCEGAVGRGRKRGKTGYESWGVEGRREKEKRSRRTWCIAGKKEEDRQVENIVMVKGKSENGGGRGKEAEQQTPQCGPPTYVCPMVACYSVERYG